MLQGAFDLHVHADPSLFPRWGSVLEVAEAAEAASMRGFLLKSHHGSSVEAAVIAARARPDVAIHGGIVLNHGVGGLNPVAVENAIALGARIVWLPTVHARRHGEVYGRLGQFDFQSSPSRHAVEGIDVCEGGTVVPAVCEILEIVRDADVALATGHISAEEIFAIAQFVRTQGWRLRLVANHVGFRIPNLAVDALRALAEQAWYLELCAFTTTQLGGGRSPGELARFFSELPDARWIVASDGGQADNPPPPELLAGYAQRLHEEGVSREVLERALQNHPAELLGL